MAQAGYLPDGPMNRAGNTINDPESIGLVLDFKGLVLDFKALGDSILFDSDC